jgi:putative ABC transport system permease protein
VYRLTLRSLLTRRRRAALSALAVLVGVAMISGAYVFTDTIRAALRDVLGTQARGAQVIVEGRQGLYSATNPPASMPASLAARIARLPGVAAAQGQITDFATVVGRDGKVVKRTGAPTLAISYLPAPFGGMRFVAGGPPNRPSEVALDAATAAREHYRVGDLVPIVTGEPVRRFRIAGLARLGSATIGGATFAVFDLKTAQALYGKQDQLDAIYVAAANGMPPQTLQREIAPLLPPGLVADTAGSAVDADISQLSDQLQILTGGLRAFGFIALLVGALVILSTFALTVAQRARELALLRALGATQAQLLRSVVAEALAIGGLASVAGVAAGLAAALGMQAALKAAGIDVPSAPLTLEPRTIAIGIAVGVGVTIVASLAPAARATSVSPMEALRGSDARDGGRWGAWPAVGTALLLAFVGAGVAFSASGSSGARLAAATVGAVMFVVAAVLLTPLVVPVVARAVAWPLERRGRIVPRLARENAIRTPGRTAITASSLMIGLALVLFVWVYVGGVRTATRHAIARTFTADYAIGSADGASPIPAASARAIAFVPDVLASSSVKTAAAQVAGAGRVTAAGLDTTSFGQVYNFDWVGMRRGDLTTLGPGDVLLERDTARAAGLRVGGPVRVTSPDGVGATLTVRGIYSDHALLRGLALPLQAFDQLFHQDRLQQVLVKLAPGADPLAAGARLEQALSDLPGVVVRSERQLADEASGRVNGILVLFYALLALSGVMALLGILGALTLSVHERTRELSLLRALGMTPAQAHALIRDESLITAAIGTLTGAALGLALGWVISRALSSEGIVFAVPWPQLGLLAALGLLVGVLAALPPARRAARIDLMTALTYE